MSLPTLNNILYVEDEEDIRTIVQFALENLGGYTLKVCRSGQEAIEAASQLTPDLMLFDVMMPKMDGPTTLKILREKYSAFENIPVIFMTAKVQPQEVEEYKRLGAIDVITKPFDPMTLADTLKKIWENHYG
ncbi:MAG: hypothetical protein DRR08_02480 [Candidatus Parabeggiatoa sp. nov. 2]|nr:MAG: hypothetical protein DRR08_02480 [Gammaproteobacteria bacterium]